MSITGITDIDLQFLKEASFNDAMKLVTISSYMRDLYYNDVYLRHKHNKIIKRVNKIMEILERPIAYLYLQPADDDILYSHFQNIMMQYDIPLAGQVEFEIMKFILSYGDEYYTKYNIEYKGFALDSDESIKMEVFPSKEQLRSFLYHAYYDNLILVL